MTFNRSTNNRTTNNRTISVKNDNDLTARQLLRVIEIQIFRSDFETAAYSSMRSLFPLLSINAVFVTLRGGGGRGGGGGGGGGGAGGGGGGWLTGAKFLNI